MWQAKMGDKLSSTSVDDPDRIRRDGSTGEILFAERRRMKILTNHLGTIHGEVLPNCFSAKASTTLSSDLRPPAAG